MSVAERDLTRSYPALPSTVRIAREELAGLAASAGASEERLDAVRLAASEALTNAVVHAYRDRPGPIHVTAAVVSDELWVLIADEGCGLRACSSRPGLGLGLALIAQLSEHFTIVRRAAGGTEIEMRFALLAAPADSPLRQRRASSASTSRATRCCASSGSA
jgi:anti-sigma regulatory factor (Ser/Thr protein kinase)